MRRALATLAAFTLLSACGSPPTQQEENLEERATGNEQLPAGDNAAANSSIPSGAMDDVGKQLAARDRFRRALSWRKTPDERMRAMMDLQRRTWETLRASPNGYAHFLRRNFKARAARSIAGDTHAA